MNSSPNAINILSFFTLLLLLTACSANPPATYHLPVLNDFSVYQADPNARHISPDGIRLMVRNTPNNPKGDLAFWKEAIRRHLDEAGYLFQSQKTIEANQTHQKGEALSFIVPYQGEDWGFAIVIFVGNEELTLVEMTGPFKNFPTAWDQLSQKIHEMKIQ
jgi:hypothetical protein